MAALLPAKPRRDLDAQLTPLINIVFLLLIFFMLAGQVRQEPAPEVRPPQIAKQPPLSAPRLTLAVTADGALSLDGEPLDPAQLAARLATPLAAEPPPTLALKADRQLPLGQLTPLLQQLRRLGVTRLTLYGAARG